MIMLKLGGYSDDEAKRLLRYLEEIIDRSCFMTMCKGKSKCDSCAEKHICKDLNSTIEFLHGDIEYRRQRAAWARK